MITNKKLLTAGFFLMLIMFSWFNLEGQVVHTLIKYVIDVTAPDKTVQSGNLKSGGINASNESVEINNFYFLIDGKPFIPVTGEFHFSRYPNKYWEESIRKMKAGGINIIATYVFWNIHEEKEGFFDWQGDKDITKFVRLCAENNMKVIVRIGPFCHGEIRNGGLPEWLFARPFSVRSNDPEYLAYVERLYNEIGKQLTGFYFKDGGPIIGIQLENEYQHSAAPWSLTYPGQPPDWTVAERDRSLTREGVSISKDENPYASLGNEHMKVLKALAVKAGMIVPVYTATGWGNAAIIENESIPVSAAYPYPSWNPTISLSNFYLYTDLQKRPDYSPVRYKSEDYPYIAAEIGGGMCNNYTRRLTIPAQSLDALINRFLGSGSNGVGYYMFHGGATPEGEKSFFADEAYAYPKINYDYQAPIGQYGQIKPSFHRLKLIHYFLNAFGDRLAPMSLYLPETNSGIIPSDSTTLRYSVRSKNGSGFIFMHNFQDYLKMKTKDNFQILVKTKDAEITIPEKSGLFLGSEENLILPFNLDIEGIRINYSTAQLLTYVGTETNPCFIFFTPEGTKAEFSISNVNVKGIKCISCRAESNKNRWLISCQDNSEFTLSRKSGGEIRILVISKETALKSWIIKIRKSSYLAFSDAMLLDDKKGLEFISTAKNTFNLSIYPGIKGKVSISSGMINETKGKESFMTTYKVELPEYKFDFQTEYFGTGKIRLTYPEFLPATVNDVFITINYSGDTGMCFMNGELIDDHFYYGQPWIIGLKKFYDIQQHQMIFYFRPMYKNAPYMIDLDKTMVPDFGNSRTFLKINEVKAVSEYRGMLYFN